MASIFCDCLNCSSARRISVTSSIASRIRCSRSNRHRVHEQRPPPREASLVLHLKIFHHMVRRQNLLEQEPKPGHAPVPARTRR